MTPFVVLWHPAHTEQLKSMGLRLAETICTAVHAAAENGSGDIRRARADHPNRIRIHVRGAVVFADVDGEAQTLTVLRILRTG